MMTNCPNPKPTYNRGSENLFTAQPHAYADARRLGHELFESPQLMFRKPKENAAYPHAIQADSIDVSLEAAPADDRDMRYVRIAVLEKLLFQNMQRAVQSVKEYARALELPILKTDDDRRRELASARRMRAQILERIAQLERLAREL